MLEVYWLEIFPKSHQDIHSRELTVNVETQQAFLDEIVYVYIEIDMIYPPPRACTHTHKESPPKAFSVPLTQFLQQYSIKLAHLNNLPL